MLRLVDLRRLFHAIWPAAAIAWICALVFVQWILLMAPSALDVEAATDIPLIDFHHWMRSYVHKPIGRPQ